MGRQSGGAVPSMARPPPEWSECEYSLARGPQRKTGGWCDGAHEVDYTVAAKMRELTSVEEGARESLCGCLEQNRNKGYILSS